MFESENRIRKREKDLDAALARDEVARPLTDVSGGVLDLMASVSPQFMRPVWCEEYASLFERAIGDNLRNLLSAPPQHGKTNTTLHGFAYLIIKYPDLKHAYITYSQERANSVSLELQNILKACGAEIKGTLNKIRWEHGDGLIMMTSIEGGITGEKINGLCVVDDPVKNLKEATSETTRRVIAEVFQTCVELRVHEGCSIFVMMTRWDPRDLLGTLSEAEDKGEKQWTHHNYPVLAEENDRLGRAVGETLFPELWSQETMDKRARTMVPEFFAALFQGRPRLRGGSVFHEPAYYTKLPENFRGAYGIDLAYTAATSGDWSINVELWREETPEGPLYYVRWVDRAKVEAPEFGLLLKRRATARPTWPMLWRYGAGGEKGVAQLIRKLFKISLRAKPAPGDKYISSLPSSILWNQGRILLPDPDTFPECSIWLDEFICVILGFTGNNKETDDDVDGLGAAHHALRSAATIMTREENLPYLRM